MKAPYLYFYYVLCLLQIITFIIFIFLSREKHDYKTFYSLFIEICTINFYNTIFCFSLLSFQTGFAWFSYDFFPASYPLFKYTIVIYFNVVLLMQIMFFTYSFYLFFRLSLIFDEELTMKYMKYFIVVYSVLNLYVINNFLLVLII
jgi:hypothetical protein